MKNRSCSQSDREQLPASSRLRQQRNHIASISPWCLTLGVASLQAASAFTSWIVSRSSALTSFISCFNSSFFVVFFFTHGKCETTRNQPDRQPCVYIFFFPAKRLQSSNSSAAHWTSPNALSPFRSRRRPVRSVPSWQRLSRRLRPRPRSPYKHYFTRGVGVTAVHAGSSDIFIEPFNSSFQGSGGRPLRRDPGHNGRGGGGGSGWGAGG